MKILLPSILVALLLPGFSGGGDWTPTKDPTKGKDLAAIGRPVDVYQHDSKPELLILTTECSELRPQQRIPPTAQQ